MPSMFRSPGEVSSSVDESSDISHVPTPAQQRSGAAQIGLRNYGELDGGTRPSITRAMTRVASTVQLSDLQPLQRQGLLHLAMFENVCKDAALDALNKNRPIQDHISKDDPLVEEHAQHAFSEFARGVGQTFMLPDELIGPSGRDLRHAAFATTQAYVNNNVAQSLSGLESTAPDVTQSSIRASISAAAGADHFQALQLSAFRGDPQASAPTLMLGNHGSLFAIPSVYRDEHEELCMLGKGGYGQVWKVRNHLDNQFYAVKKIVISSQRLQKFSQNAQLEALLDELRTLAKLHHTNIVRYFGGWIEKSSSIPAMNKNSEQKLLQGLSSSEFEFETSTNATFDETEDGPRFEELNLSDEPELSRNETNYHDAVVFGDDSISQGLSIPITSARNRGASRSTNSSAATFTKASLLSVGEEDDVETIPRSLDRQVSVSHMMHSRTNSPPRRTESTYYGPDITLFIKMSLHPTTLASFLSPDPPAADETIKLRHCFHKEPSIGMVSAILDGVEYLHSQRIVHRDLKPANIFLSIQEDRPPATTGFVDIHACNDCEKAHCISGNRKHIYVTPCIGDFGLIAEMKDSPSSSSSQPNTFPQGESSSSSPSTSTFEPSPLAQLNTQGGDRPVGTQFYRPAKLPAKEPKICPKLDVYSLGVITFELLWKFGTRTERAMLLNDLGAGKVPKKFESHTMCDGIKGMVTEERDQRWDCAKVREWLEQRERLSK